MKNRPLGQIYNTWQRIKFEKNSYRNRKTKEMINKGKVVVNK